MRLRVAATLALASVLLGSPLPAKAAELSRIWIERSALSSELEQGLREELSADRLAPDEASADVAVSIEPDRNAIVPRIRSSSSGRVLLERRIGVDHGQAPALRAALLVAVEALAASKKAPVGHASRARAASSSFDGLDQHRGSGATAPSPGRRFDLLLRVLGDVPIRQWVLSYLFPCVQSSATMPRSSPA